MSDIIPPGTKVQVSSTAAGTSRRSLLKDDDEAWTCVGVPSSITLSFPKSVTAAKVGITFQGGFVATSISITATTPEGEVRLGKVFPEDVNRRQVLELPTPAKDVSQLRLDLEASSDHHERVTIYRLELLA